MEKKYLEFVKEFKDGDNIDDILKNNINVDKEISVISSVIDIFQDLEELFVTLDPIIEYYMKKSIIFFKIIKEYTVLKLEIGEDSIDNYNIILEENLKQNKFIKRIYKNIEDILQKKELNIVKELNIALKNIPSAEETNEIIHSFEKLFSDKNQENLQVLKDIVEFNDPSMKVLKETVYDGTAKIINNAINQNKNEGE